MEQPAAELVVVGVEGHGGALDVAAFAAKSFVVEAVTRDEFARLRAADRP